MPADESTVRWRAGAPYTPTSLLRQALLEETRQFLLTYRDSHAAITNRQALRRELPQRSVYSRADIVKTIKMRLIAWNPPDWVMADLAEFARDEQLSSLQSVLLLHLARQDLMAYDFIQSVVVPRWQSGEATMTRGDVHRFLDLAEPCHPETGRWSYSVRHKLVGNTLTILRDYGLLSGAGRVKVKQIVEPTVPTEVARHLVRLLRAEGVSDEEMPRHQDWRIWLWDPGRAAGVLAGVPNGGPDE